MFSFIELFTAEPPGFPGGSVVKNLPVMQETEEMQVQPPGGEDPLEEGMATPCSILAWRIAWTEEPGGCGLRVGMNEALEHNSALIFDCTGSLLLCGSSLGACTSFSLWWLLLLWNKGSGCPGFSSCGSRASLLRCTCDLPRPGTEPVSSALAGGFFATETPGKPDVSIFNWSLYVITTFFFQWER